ncbi:MAG: DUF433 domain-containing protein [Chloroflexi bacterium]|nr:DUF433 domain-containing protein [Chloroflexota bacterium]
MIAADDSLVLGASGSSIARRLAWENTLLGRTFDGASLSSAVTTLLAGTSWTAGSLDAPATTLLARFDGLPVWAALAKVAEVFGLHLREDPWNREVDLGAFGATSGIVLQNVEAVSPALRENRLLAPIAKLEVLEESADVWNRVIPLGAGEGVNKLDLRYATRSSPYAVQSAAGPDGRTYWYLDDAASVAAYGRRTRVLSVKDALPLANSPEGEDDFSGERRVTDRWGRRARLLPLVRVALAGRPPAWLPPRVGVDRDRLAIPAWYNATMAREMLTDHRNRIVTDPEILSGEPVLKGSNVPVELVIRRLAEGLNVDALLRENPSLTEDDVRASLLYAREALEGAAKSPYRPRTCPATRSLGRKHTTADLEAFLASAGGWAEVDTDRFLKDIYESRDRLPGPPVTL